MNAARRDDDEPEPVDPVPVAVIHNDDLAWARPYVDQARACVARGDVMSGEEFFGRLNAQMASLRSS